MPQRRKGTHTESRLTWRKEKRQTRRGNTHGEGTHTKKRLHKEGTTRGRDYTTRGGDYTGRGHLERGHIQRGDYIGKGLHGEGTTRGGTTQGGDYTERGLYGEETHTERRLHIKGTTRRRERGNTERGQIRRGDYSTRKARSLSRPGLANLD